MAPIRLFPGNQTANIVTHARKVLAKDKTLIDSFKTIPFIQNPETHNGKTLWSNKDLRVDFAFNAPGSKEVFVNWQKNKGSKLEGLKGFSTHDKIFTQAIQVGVELSEQEISEQMISGFRLSGS